MVDKTLPAGGPDPYLGDPTPQQVGAEVSLDSPQTGEIGITENEDGSVTIDGDSGQTGSELLLKALRSAPFDANLAEYLEPSVLRSMCADLMQRYDEDKLSRDDWEMVFRKGIDLLGIKIEDRTFPFKGACGIQDPMIAEAVVRFQSNCIMEIFPEGGPARSKILGNLTPEKQEKAQRIEDYYNYLLTEQLPEYRPETEKLLFSLAFCGAAFRKIYADPVCQCPAAVFISADQFIVPFGVSTLEKAPRYTEIHKYTKNDIRQLQASGFYLDEEFGSPVMDRTALEDKKTEVGAQGKPFQEEYYTNLEMHCDYDIPGLEDESGVALPYIVHIQKDSDQILAIYRNWDQNDPKKRKIIWYADYAYIPGIGFYGLGLIHLAGGLAKGSSSILRQLIDAGTLANLRAGFKTRGLRIKGDDTPLAPGEWRDVDVPSGKISECIFPMPYGEPSATLLTLREGLVDDGRRLCSIADVEIGDVGAQAPVGTTLSIMERAMKVMSAVQARVHESLHKEFKILRRVIKMVTPPEYPYDVEGGSRIIKHSDFDGSVDVVPTSNPNAATMSQRITQYQAMMQSSAQFPGSVDNPAMLRRVAYVLGIPNVNELIPQKGDIPYADPVTENGNIINSKPAKAFPTQDHVAHIQTHMSFLQDPQIQQYIGQNPQAQQIQGALMSHVLDHLQYKYRADIEKQMGVPLPPPGQTLPPQIEMQLSQMIAQGASQLLGRDQKEAQMQKAQQMQQDPVYQLQQQQMQIKQSTLQHQIQNDQQRNALDAQKAANQSEIEKLRIAVQAMTEDKRLASQERQNEKKISAQILQQLQNHAAELESIKTDQVRLMSEIHKMIHGMTQPGASVPETGNAQ